MEQVPFKEAGQITRENCRSCRLWTGKVWGKQALTDKGLELVARGTRSGDGAEDSEKRQKAHVHLLCRVTGGLYLREWPRPRLGSRV